MLPWHLIHATIRWYKSIKRNKGEFNYIVETCDITPKKAKELFNQDDTILLFLGTPKLSIVEHFNEIRKYETQRDWTYNRSDEEILNHVKYWLDKSKKFEKECKELDIWFVDTSFNRKKALNHTLKNIEKLINCK